MPLPMRSLRFGLVAVAVLLVAVLAGYIGYARRKANQFVHDLPRRLGIDITQETDNFTYSQSLKGKTIFTVHAARAIQHKDGVITLRDVGIVLYGTSGNRADRIHGQEFQYDQKQGVLSAVGEALIDLAPPGDKAPDEAQMIHVKTSGLVFRKESGTAETSGPIEFMAHGLVGQAVGAAYDSHTSVLVLQSQVKMSGLRNNRPMTLTAARAELQRAQNTLLLDAPRYVSATESGPQSVSAAQAVVHTGDDGKPRDVQAHGQLQLAGAGRGRVDAERMDVTLNDDGQPRDGHLYGGVRFVDDSPQRQEHGRAAEVRVAFDPVGRPRHAVLTGAVQLDEAAGPGTRHLDTKQLNAERVELDLSGGGRQKLVLRGAVAKGGDGARLRLADLAAKGPAATNLRADTLTGRFGPAGLMGLDGTGRTQLERVQSNGKGQQLSKETSTGDSLKVDLKPQANGRMELSHVVQRGSVVIVREAVGKTAAAPAEVEHARAANAEYQADRDQLTLAGGAELSDAASALFADKVQLDRGTGDALAEGSVRVSYLEGKPGSEPVHVLAGRAVAHKADGLTQFTAAAGARVRMWQGGSQVEAPMLDLNRTKKSMAAHGSGEGSVRTLLSSEGKPGAKTQPPVRIVSDQMTYTDAARQIDFTGHVLVSEPAGTLHAQQATAYLSAYLPADRAAGTSPRPDALFAGKLERVVGKGSVELNEPGRKASGDRIVYTAADESYVLTGTKAIPPRLADDQHGTVTGAQLRFRRGDESVEVTGADGSRVRSEPRARQ